MASFNSHSVSNIVDDWMKDANDLLPSTCADDEQEPVQSNISSNQKGRVGLGFDNKSSTGADGSRVKNDALLEKLKKSDKKRKREADQQLQSHSMSHGLVEDDEEFESRIKLVSSLSMKVEGHEEQKKPVVSSKSVQKSNKNNESDVKTTQSNNMKTVSNIPEPVKPVPVLSEPKGVETGHSNLADSQTDKSKKRKRIKTRSKQKNIRRDNRPDDQKPSHLKFGSNEYKGRPITSQTREKLGLPTKKAKHEHFSG